MRNYALFFLAFMVGMNLMSANDSIGPRTALARFNHAESFPLNHFFSSINRFDLQKLTHCHEKFWFVFRAVLDASKNDNPFKIVVQKRRNYVFYCERMGPKLRINFFHNDDLYLAYIEGRDAEFYRIDGWVQTRINLNDLDIPWDDIFPSLDPVLIRAVR